MNEFKTVCATQLGSLGMQLWGVTRGGRLAYTFQKGLNAGWEPWKRSESSKARNLVSLTAAQDAQGVTSLWAVDSNGGFVSNKFWGETWRDEWVTNPTPANVKLALIYVCEPSDKVGRQLWGVDSHNKVYYQRIDDGGGWVQWKSARWKGFQNATALTAAPNAEGWTAVWAVDNGVLLSRGLGPDGWNPSDDWKTNPPPRTGYRKSGRDVKFASICVCKQGGGLGRALWGVGEKGELWWQYEEGGTFSGWKEFPGPGQPVKSLCVGRNDGRVTLWALSEDDSLHNITQTTADHVWANFTESEWDAGGTRPPSKPSLLTEIATVLGRGTDAKYRGVTYEVTSHNTFTLLDTPRLWDQSSTAPNPIPACDVLLDKIAETIGQARTIVDITAMTEFVGNHGELPSGGFQKALSRGFRSLVTSNRSPPPLVRITIGITIPSMIGGRKLLNWVKTTIELDGGKLDDVTFPILIGAGKETAKCWNHSKIVAADGVRAVVGGHNLWGEQYLGAAPVHDVSGLFEGSVVRAVHRFCDQLWTNHGTNPFFVPGAWVRGPGKGWEKVSGKIPRPSIASPTPKGNTRMLALGRLGDGIVTEFTVATNASVSARIIALCRARKSIRISQQSLYNSVANLTTGFDFYTLLAIIKAVQAGVKVDIVVTNDLGLLEGGYEAFLQKVVDSLAALQIADCLSLYPRAGSLKSREDLVAWASASLKPPAEDIPLAVSKLPTEAQSARPLAQLNAKLKLARLYYAAPNVNYWQVGSKKKNAVNHAKVYIIDDTHFYVGSDNMYLSGSARGHQEYGYLIEGQPETKEFIENYWKKLWRNSSSHLVPPIQFPKNRRRELWIGPAPVR